MNIAFIAMSGIRACDAELLELGLTLPGFVERSKTIASLPSLGLLTLAGMTPTEHEVTYHEVADLQAAGNLPTDCDLAAISTFSAQSLEAYELAERLRARGVMVVIGGLHATALPEEAAKCGISAVAGEGEMVWHDVLRDAAAGRLQPVYDARRYGEFNLADAPMPRFELLGIGRYNRLTVQTSRGCPWRCSFCASSILLTGRYKQKPIDRVLAEIDRIRDIWPRPFIEFADDNAFVDRVYWKRLLPKLERRHIKWFAETDLSIWEDSELLTLMRRAGCAEVLIGLESPTQYALADVETRRNWKQRQFPNYRKAVTTIQEHGIRVNACFVIGLDGHTQQVFSDVYNFAAERCPFDVQVTYPTPFPGTPLYQSLQRQGRLTHDGQWNRCTLFDINFEPTPMSADELRSGFRELVSRLYGRSFTDYRREVFRRQWRGAPAMN